MPYSDTRTFADCGQLSLTVNVPLDRHGVRLSSGGTPYLEQFHDTGHQLELHMLQNTDQLLTIALCTVTRNPAAEITIAHWRQLG